MAALPPKMVIDFSGGSMDDLSVSDTLMPKNAVRKAMNVLTTRPRGAATQRLGTTKLGGDVESAKTILGLFNFRASTTSSTSRLLAAANGTIYYLNSSTWTSILGSLNTSAKVRFVEYLDVVAAMNGTDAVKTWDGTAGAWIATGGPLDVGNFPVTKFAAILNGRVCAAGNSTNPSRLYQSSIVSAGAVSWTSGNKTVDVHPNDGTGELTSLQGNGKFLLLFKNRSLFRYDDNELVRVVNIGTPSHESVSTDDNGIVYFFGQGANGVGFYKTTGGYPVKISRAITKWVEAIDPAFYTNISSYTDGSRVYWSIGSVTIDDTTYTNAWLVYNIADQTWEQRNYADRFRVFAQYINTSNALTTVAGDTDGMVQTIDSGYTDNTTAIYSELEGGPIYASPLRARVCTVHEIYMLSRDFQGITGYMKVDSGDYELIGTTEAREKKFPTNFRGRTFYPKITAVNSGPPFIFEGFVLSDMDDEGWVP